MAQLRQTLQQFQSSRNATPRGVRANETAVSANSVSARITVELPANARLYVDNVRCPLSSNKRSFLTPKLAPGKRYFYTLRTETTRNGQAQQSSRRVVVRAGEHVRVDFNKPELVNTVRR